MIENDSRIIDEYNKYSDVGNCKNDSVDKTVEDVQ